MDSQDHSPHLFDSIITDRPMTYDLLGKCTRKWKVIYADPPWEFKNWSEKGEDRNANQHYNTMAIDDLMAMPVKDIADDDSVLFLWVTDPTLPHAMKLINAWGFEYATVANYWVKTWPKADLASMDEKRSFPMGGGYGTRANPEQLWLATRGSPQRRIHLINDELKQDMSIRRLQFAPRARHSEKPHKFYDIIERLYEGPYLEMFTRKTKPGWAYWGNQVGLLNDPHVRTKKAKAPPAPMPLLEGAG